MTENFLRLVLTLIFRETFVVTYHYTLLLLTLSRFHALF